MTSTQSGTEPPAQGPREMLHATDAGCVGRKTFLPGEVYTNHLHPIAWECFVVEKGTVTLWLDRGERVMLSAGDSYTVPAGVEHCPANETDSPATLLYVRAPYSTKDVVTHPWDPREA